MFTRYTPWGFHYAINKYKYKLFKNTVNFVQDTGAKREAN
jgi:hypothetical protein